eukprot:jgi/Ulvmu1/1156/UM107_0030.1
MLALNDILPVHEFSGITAVFLVIAFGAFFWALEIGLDKSPIATVFEQLLMKNPKMSKEEAEKCVPMVITRIVGFIHNTVQVPIAIWVICHPQFAQNRFYGSHPISQLMLCGSAGFFLHDAVSCLIRESPFYVVHGLTCCLGYTAGAYLGLGHFYGGLFLLWEISTPFVQLRWILYKMGATETTAYAINGLLMVFSFGMVRVVFGTYFTGLLYYDTWKELKSDSKTPDAFPAGVCAAATIVSCLNYYWFSLMIKSLVKIFYHGHTWTHASDKTDKKIE